MMFLCVILLFVLALPVGRGDDDCQQGFADTCFSAVTGDLTYMLNLKKMIAVNVTRAAVHDLCLSIEDSLNCTADIVETECGNDEELNSFESWLKALRASYSCTCAGSDHKSLTTLLRGIECWSIEDFLMCTEEQLGISHVRDLLHIAIDETECKNIHSAFTRCNRVAAVGSCREQDDVSEEVGKLIDAFTASACTEHQLVLLPSRAAYPLSLHFSTLILLLSTLLLWL